MAAALRVCVIIPMYKSALTIERALDSIAAQDYPALDVVCVDDCSPDETIDVVKAYQARKTLPITLIAQPENLGAGAARNVGLEAVTADMIAFLDADDAWRPSKLTKQLALMNETGAEMSHTHYTRHRHTPQGPAVEKLIQGAPRVRYQAMLKKNHLPTSTMVVRANLVGSHRFPALRKRQDYAFWLRLMRGGAVSVGVQESLVDYYETAGSLSRSSKVDLLRYNYRVFHEEEGFAPPRAAYHVALNVLHRVLQ